MSTKQEPAQEIKPKRFAIGFDLGHSAVKIARPNGSPIIFPSLAGQALAITHDAEAKRAEEETVRVNGTPYFFGETAYIQLAGTSTSGLSEEWIETSEHTALFLGGLKKLEQAGVRTDSNLMLVMGLPMKQHAHQKDHLKELVKGLLPNAEILVVPQPWGPYQLQMLDASGRQDPKHDMMKDSWGVIEVGYYTTDFMMVRMGRWVERGSGPCDGVHKAAEHLKRLLDKKKMRVDLADCANALQTKTIIHFGSKQDVGAEVGESLGLLSAKVMDSAARYFDAYAQHASGILVAGGGASMVLPDIRKKWPHAIMVPEPRFAVAEGMRRFGELMLTHRATP